MKHAFLPVLLCASFWTVLPNYWSVDGLISSGMSSNNATVAGVISTDASAPESLSPSAFVQWVHKQENKLVQTHHAGDLHFIATYLPTDYMACNHLQAESIDSKTMQEARSGFADMEFYRFRIQVDGAQTPAHYQVPSLADYQQRIAYFAYDMQNQLYLQNADGLRVSCDYYVFERSYNMAPYHTFLIGFSKTPGTESDTWQLVLEDQLYGQGRLTFAWDRNDIQAIPKVTLL